ncbi:DUF2490 domain-containing protein [Marinoscillum sp.]|uniref:DUF2490 domain-containing protein n=1 Tax=Marinoscillum sp. TaxID=2024838 RepID=UPI00387336E4
MKNIYIWSITILLMVAPELKAQITETYTDAWFLLLNDYKVNERWTIGNELHWRNVNFLKDKEQLLIRPYVDYHVNENVVFTAGYTYIRSYPYRELAVPLTRPEHNIWEQVTLNHSANKFTFSHRYRLEHRFQGLFSLGDADVFEVDGYQFSNRFRYRFTVRHPIGEKYFIHVFDELWIRTDDNFQNANFDRNWLYLGLGRNLTAHSNIQLAYLHQMIRLNALLNERHPTLQLTYQHRFERSLKN